MFVSVTRLRLRRWWFLPPFALHAIRSRSQLRRSAGFIVGGLAAELPFAFWTITIWTDEKAMRAFRNTEAHVKAMPRLSHWCDEASYVHWEQADDTMPSAITIFDRLRDSGKLSKVRHPSQCHAAGDKVGARPPAAPNIIRPAARATAGAMS